MVVLESAIIAAFVTAVLAGVVSVLRYIFDVQLLTGPEVDERIQTANRERKEDFNRISETLEAHTEQLENIETLIMGSEYQVSDGMLELVEMNREDAESQEERIEGVERIQLKIRRRQKEHSGGEPVAHSEDLDPPPKMDEEDIDTNN